MAEHTTGPLEVLEEDGEIIVCTPSGIAVARMSVDRRGRFGLSYEQQLARARSYCAHEDLLAACRAFRGAIGQANDHVHEALLHQAAQLADEAIARATQP